MRIEPNDRAFLVDKLDRTVDTGHRVRLRSAQLSAGERVYISGEMVRIGRHPDNDLWLAEESVHRYHAVIQHGEDGAYSITDVSGPSGNGLKLNAAKVNHARLANGDVIELGRARLTFMCAPV